MQDATHDATTGQYAIGQMCVYVVQAFMAIVANTQMSQQLQASGLKLIPRPLEPHNRPSHQPQGKRQK
ncbi:hypothetical protein DNTS_003575 [Danionella cerebrum]|uniref:Uncharacterized protein n=1 Tax=Danionella cerebrum TaxID=2873325 RepID=A0A553PZK0_9TELE|nr:hypothetical protein DNTS_003575 [Danionella translucida]